MGIVYRADITTKGGTGDAVEWRRRCFNSGADAAAYLGLKYRGRKDLTDEEKLVLREGNFDGLQIHVDGGFDGQAGAAGVTFTSFTWKDGAWVRHLVGHAHSSFKCQSAFDAESRALAAATVMLSEIVHSWVT